MAARDDTTDATRARRVTMVLLAMAALACIAAVLVLVLLLTGKLGSPQPQPRTDVPAERMPDDASAGR